MALLPHNHNRRYVCNEDFDKAVACYRYALRLDDRHYNAWSVPPTTCLSLVCCGCCLHVNLAMCCAHALDLTSPQLTDPPGPAPLPTTMTTTTPTTPGTAWGASTSGRRSTSWRSTTSRAPSPSTTRARCVRVCVAWRGLDTHTCMVVLVPACLSPLSFSCLSARSLTHLSEPPSPRLSSSSSRQVLHCYLGMVLHAAGKSGQALDMLERASLMEPRNPQVGVCIYTHTHTPYCWGPSFHSFLFHAPNPLCMCMEHHHRPPHHGRRGSSVRTC